MVVVTGLLIAGCTAKSFWLLARHGTRNPGEDDISLMEIKAPDIQQAILENYENGRGKVRVLFKILQLYSVLHKNSNDFCNSATEQLRVKINHFLLKNSVTEKSQQKL